MCRVFFLNKNADLRQLIIKNETPVEVFSCEFCDAFKNTCFYTILQVAAFEVKITSRCAETVSYCVNTCEQLNLKIVLTVSVYILHD